MFELLTLFLTGGGSAAMGSILKGVFGAVTDARSQKHEMEMARECRNNEAAIQFQASLNNGASGAFTRATRRMGGKNFYSDSSVFQQSKPLWLLQQDISHSSKQQ